MAGKDEKYLDNLLNSVLASQPARTARKPKKESRPVEDIASRSDKDISSNELFSGSDLFDDEIFDDSYFDDNDFFGSNGDFDDGLLNYNILDDSDIPIFDEDLMMDDIIGIDNDELLTEAFEYETEEGSGRTDFKDEIKEPDSDVLMDESPVSDKKQEDEIINDVEEDAEGIDDEIESYKEINDKDSGVDDLLQNLFQDMNDETAAADNDADASDDDIMNLLNTLNDKGDSEGEAGADNILSIDDFNNDMNEENNEEIEPIDINNFEDDFELDDLLADIEDRTPYKEEDTSSDKDAATKANKKKKKNKKKSADGSLADEAKEKKPGLLKRIFGNTPDSITEEERAKMKAKVVADYEAKENAAIDKENKKELNAQEKEEKKKAAIEEAKIKKAEASKAKAEKEKQKKEKKDAKKDEKLKRQQEIKDLVDEIDENTGKINKVGSALIFICCTAFALFVIIGTNILTYNKSMEDAKNYYSRQYYNEAFDSVYGLTIKEEDAEFYEQILTVMYVQKQLNSYENYVKLELYANALDSLLKGLVLYDKFYTKALLINIENDLLYVKDRILIELEDAFGISSKQAESLIKSYDNDRLAYSNSVYEYASIYENSNVGIGE